jgi:hypothetical protein
MANGTDVLKMLFPNGGWAIRGDEYEGIDFINIEPINKAEYDKAFAGYDVWKAKLEAETATTKAAAEAKLAALGLTADDLKALGLGNN